MSEIAPRQLILTLYGLYARDEHNWLSVNSVVKLLGDLDIDSAGVRSSISRLKRRGVLGSMRVGQSAGYTLSGETLEVLREGDTRIFSRLRAVEDDGFVLVVYSIPEAEREKRHQLRTTLTQMGFGTTAPGVWIAPGHLRGQVASTLTRLDMESYVDLFDARYEAFGDLRQKVTTWWDLPAIDEEYAQFIDHHRDARSRWKESTDAARTAFEIYVPLLTQWRRLPYLDPGLPSSLLPADWNGGKAANLFADLDALLRTSAREHAMAIIHG
ncbi:MAG: PaaX family transcriptional regulator [Kineosporiaceae bacterium]|nr:PaaX family transcriptional regulator [Aeromicrobium sp.]